MCENRTCRFSRLMPSMTNYHHLQTWDCGASLYRTVLVKYNHQNCTLLHILNCCSFSLQNGRYNWHHDQTLRAIIATGLATYVTQHELMRLFEGDIKRHFKINILFNIKGTFWHQNDFHIIFISKVMDNLFSNCLITLKINYQDMGR